MSETKKDTFNPFPSTDLTSGPFRISRDLSIRLGIDASLRKLFIDKTLRYGVQIGDPLSDDTLFQVKIEMDLQSTDVLLNGQKIGMKISNFDGKIVLFLKFRVKTLMNIITSAIKKETSIISPEGLLNNLVILILSRNEYKNQIFLERDPPTIHLCKKLRVCSSFDQFKDKMIDLVIETPSFLRVLQLDKIKIVQSLIEHSLSFRDKSLGKFSEIITKQSNLEKIYDNEIAQLILKLSEKQLHLLNKLVIEIFKERNLSFENVYTESSVDSMPEFVKYNKTLNIDYCPNFHSKIVDLNLVLDEMEISATDDTLKFPDADQPNKREIIKDYPILMDVKKVNILKKYQSDNIDILLNLDQTNANYSKLRDIMQPNDPHYFGNLKLRSLKYNEEKSAFSFKYPKSYKMDRIISVPKFQNNNNLFDHKSFINGTVVNVDKDVIYLQQLLKIRNAVILFIGYNRLVYILKSLRNIAAIIINVRSERTYIIKDDLVEGLEFHLYIRGVVDQVDSGAAYVSLIYNGNLYKTWIWKHVDIKHFLTAYSRFVAIAFSVDSKLDDIDTLYKYLHFIVLSLIDNSWGLSRLYKVYKYCVINCVYGSVSLQKSFKKFFDECEKYKDSYINKRSFNYLLHLLEENYSNLPIGQSPTFKFNRFNFLHEALFLNLCPKDTYGKRRHRVNMTKSFIEEINLYSKVSSDIFSIHQDAKRILKDLYKNSSEELLRDQIVNHMLLIDLLSNKSDGRFTFSPIFVVSLYPIIERYKARLLESRSSVNIVSLFTSKSSFDSLNYKNSISAESLSSLLQRYNESSVILLCYYLFEDLPIDLTYRMFDKDQVGGDREISILSGEFRILQSVTEAYCSMIGLMTGSSFLDSPLKLTRMKDIQNLNITSDFSLSCSIDQTRWGPNFNTVIFSYMLLLISRIDPNAYVPALTCALAEQKIFQVLHYPELFEYMRTGYTLPGVQGQSHMGEGIFHYTSTLYHCFVQSFIEDSYYDSAKIKLGNDLQMRTASMITSDDVATVLMISRRDSKYKIKESDKLLSRKVLSNYIPYYKNLLKYFSIKTSDYKNRFSYNRQWEFNSIFLDYEGIPDSSLKFINSLINPLNQGNLVLDLNNSFSVYNMARISGVSHKLSLLITVLNVQSVLIKWRRNGKHITSVVVNLMRELLEQPNKILMYLPQSFETDPNKMPISRTYLKFKTKKRLEKTKNQIQTISTQDLIKNQLAIRLDDLMKGKSLEESVRRSFVIPRDVKLHPNILLPSSVQKTLNCTFVTPEVYSVLPLLGVSLDHLYTDRTKIVAKSIIDVEYPVGFNVVSIREMRGGSFDEIAVLVSSYPSTEYVNYHSDEKDVLCHILRHYHYYTVKYNFESNEIMERLAEIKKLNELNLRNSNVNTIMFTKEPTAHTKVLLSHPVVFSPNSQIFELGINENDLFKCGGKLTYVFGTFRGFQGGVVSRNQISTFDQQPISQLTSLSYEIREGMFDRYFASMIQNMVKNITDLQEYYLNIELFIKENEDKSYDLSIGNDYIKTVKKEERSQGELMSDLMQFKSILLEEFGSEGQEALESEWLEDEEIQEEELEGFDFKSLLMKKLKSIEIKWSSDKPTLQEKKVLRKTFSIKLPKESTILMRDDLRFELFANIVIFQMVERKIIQSSFIPKDELYYSTLLRSLSCEIEQSTKQKNPILATCFNLIEIIKKIYQSPLYEPHLTAGETIKQLIDPYNQRSFSFKPHMPALCTIGSTAQGKILSKEQFLVLLEDRFN
jgi:hypothetical protein